MSQFAKKLRAGCSLNPVTDPAGWTGRKPISLRGTVQQWGWREQYFHAF